MGRNTAIPWISTFNFSSAERCLHSESAGADEESAVAFAAPGLLMGLAVLEQPQILPCPRPRTGQDDTSWKWQFDGNQRCHSVSVAAERASTALFFSRRNIPGSGKL